MKFPLKTLQSLKALKLHLRRLTVLTGETGAGKSIIIDAVQLLAGGRGSQEFIRHGATKAELEGLFTIEDRNIQLLQN